jgi:hypothetical protein
VVYKSTGENTFTGGRVIGDVLSGLCQISYAPNFAATQPVASSSSSGLVKVGKGEAIGEPLGGRQGRAELDETGVGVGHRIGAIRRTLTPDQALDQGVLSRLGAVETLEVAGRIDVAGGEDGKRDSKVSTVRRLAEARRLQRANELLR